MADPLNGIFLRAGPITVGVAPHWGGALTRFDLRVRDSVIDILRPWVEQTPGTRCSLGASCFPLVPYGGRLREGRFEFERRSYRYPLNALPERHSSHGDGWSRSWSLSSLGRRRAVMQLEPDEDAPFLYDCIQTVTVHDDRVSIRLTARNADARRIPMGFGLHPYFVRRPDTRITASLPVRRHWDPEMMPIGTEPNSYADGFARGQRIDGLPFACEFAEWDGEAVVDWPTVGVRVRIHTTPKLRHAVMWMPAGRDFFCFEPVSHASDALNTPTAEHFIVLEPGAVAEQHFDFMLSTFEPDAPDAPGAP